MLFKSFKGIGGQHIMIAVEEEIKEEEMECVLWCFSDAKTLDRDGITNDYFDPFVQQLKCPLII